MSRLRTMHNTVECKHYVNVNQILHEMRIAIHSSLEMRIAIHSSLEMRISIHSSLEMRIPIHSSLEMKIYIHSSYLGKPAKRKINTL